MHRGGGGRARRRAPAPAVDHQGPAISLHNLARAELALGAPEKARGLATESLEIAEPARLPEVLAYWLATVGELALAQGAEEAGRLLGHADALFAETGVARYGEEAEAQERALASLAGRLGDDRLRNCRGEGAALTPEAAIAETGAVTGPNGDPG